MASKLTVVVSRGQSQNPVKRQLEDDVAAGLEQHEEFDVRVMPNLYDLPAGGVELATLKQIPGPLVVVSWHYSRAAHWILDRQGVPGRAVPTLLEEDADDEDELDEEADAEEKHRVVDHRAAPDRAIYCLDLRVRKEAQDFIDEVRRIQQEHAAELAGLMAWIEGSPDPQQLERYLAPGNGNGNGNGAAPPADPGRRWYPVIDFSRCTNCMECIDFCLFGVYGVDQSETILVEQPDNCRKGCPACSRVCPENAIIFPQHKTPAIAGAPGMGAALKIDLSRLFGAPDAIDVAAQERDEQLLLAGRDAVGLSVGIPKRQEGGDGKPRDEMDDLIDELDDLDL